MSAKKYISNGAKGIFVTGTDTGVGKTVVVGLLAKFLEEQGLKVITQKWIQTGDNHFSSDINRHLKLMGKSKKDLKQYLSLVAPYVFKFGASPHLAAAKEKKVIRADKIKASFKRLADNFDCVIVEGVGGSLVPINKKRLVIDIAGDLGLRTLVVAANKLGAINHSLLTIEAIRRRKMNLIGLVFNNLDRKVDKQITQDNPKIVELLSQVKVLGVLPYLKDGEALYKRFTRIAKKII